MDAQGTGTVVFETSPKDGFVGTSVLTSMHSLTMNAPVQDLVPGSGPQFPSQADVGKATSMGSVRWQHSDKHREYLGYLHLRSAEDVVLAFPGMGLEAKAPESQPPLEHGQVWCLFCCKQVQFVDTRGRRKKQMIEHHLKTTMHKRNTPLGAPKMSGVCRKRSMCKVDGCDKMSQGGKCEGMCKSHYKEINPEAVAAMNAKNIYPRCKVDGCDKQSQAKCEGMCASHYKEINPEAVAAMNAKRTKRTYTRCKVDGCDKKSQAKCEGMCKSHYKEINPEAVAAMNAKAKNIYPRCKVDGCDKKSRGKKYKGMCKSHFKAT